MMLVTDDRNLYMKKLLTIVLSISFFAFGQAKAGEGKAIVVFPKDGDCVGMIAQGMGGKDSDLKFLQAVQNLLEDGYVAKGNFSTIQRSSGQQLFVTLYKEDC